MGSKRRFGITSDLSGLSQGLMVNNISFTEESQVAEARNQYGQLVDLAVYANDKNVTIDGLYLGDMLSGGSVINIGEEQYMVTSTARGETNIGFQTGTVNAQRISGEFSPIPPQPPTPTEPSITFNIPNTIVWDFENSSTSSINFANYVVATPNSTGINYELTDQLYTTLPNGVVFNDGVLSANKSQMSDDYSTILSLNVSASFSGGTSLISTSPTFNFIVENVVEPEPPFVPVIIFNIPNTIVWDFENSSTSSINFANYVQVPCSSAVEYALTNNTLPNGVVFNDGVLSANKENMTSDYSTSMGLQVSAALTGDLGSVVSTSPTFNFDISNVVEPQPDGSLTFKGLSSTNAVSLVSKNSPDPVTLKYQKNYRTWTDYTIGDIITFNQGETVSFSGANDHFSKNVTDYYYFAMSGQVAASGSVQSLMNNSNSCTSACYRKLFVGCKALVTAPSLPATNLYYYCYANMFENCTSLTSGPSQLPSDTASSYCYQYMFSGCTSLLDAPTISATTIQPYCCRSMFDGCSSLTGVQSVLPAMNVSWGSYQDMFKGCTSLSTSPQLPATGYVGERCYQGMFQGCTSLIDGPSALPLTGSTSDSTRCYENMFSGCTHLTGVPSILPLTSLPDYCYQRMFAYCTSLKDAPELPAEVVNYGCYTEMFNGCSSLSSINVAFKIWNSSYGSHRWVSGVPNTGMFYKPTTLPESYDESHIPKWWTVINK